MMLSTLDCSHLSLVYECRFEEPKKNTSSIFRSFFFLVSLFRAHLAIKIAVWATKTVRSDAEAFYEASFIACRKRFVNSSVIQPVFLY